MDEDDGFSLPCGDIPDLDAVRDKDIVGGTHGPGQETEYGEYRQQSREPHDWCYLGSGHPLFGGREQGVLTPTTDGSTSPIAKYLACERRFAAEPLYYSDPHHAAVRAAYRGNGTKQRTRYRCLG
jgi:hypothetical protein